ncbi:MAG TPA: TolC family protein [Gemmatimonadaceae bacterium]
MNRFVRLLIAAGALWPVAAAAQQGRTLSLDEALRLAESHSEAVRIARAGVDRARGQELQARSLYLPQVGASFTYTRTLASQFEALADAGPPTPPPGTPPPPPDDGTTYYTPCTRYLAPAGSSDPQRVAGLETFARCASSTGGLGIDFSKVGFGAENQYQLGLQGSIDLFTGGRAQAQNRAARASRTAADIELTSQRAQLALTVVEAYFDAVLADRLVAIAESSLAQTESVLGQTRLARQVGNQSEFELLRAQVTRDNQLPVVIQRRTGRDLAYLRLKQLLNLPYADSLQLTTGLGDAEELLATTRAAGLPAATDVSQADTAARDRAPVRQLEASLRAQQAQLAIARSARLPSLSLSTQYGRVAFPAGGLPEWSNFLTNWTVSLTMSVPLFTGGRLRGDALVAEANVREAEARLDQTRELAALDAQQAIAQLAQAEAALAASAGTAEQAARAYQIAEVRYREGLSTQIELNDARLLLSQASANRAQAVRDLQVARMRLALLRDLPLGTGGMGLPAGGAGSVMPSGTTMPLPSIALPGTQPSTGTPPVRAAANQGSPP